MISNLRDCMSSQSGQLLHESEVLPNLYSCGWEFGEKKSMKKYEWVKQEVDKKKS